MLSEQLLRMAAGLLVGIWVARYLGPAQFGLFSYVVAFTALFGSLAKLGLDSILVRELVHTPEMRDIYLSTAFWLKLMGAAIMLAAMAVAVQFTSNDVTTNLYIFIIGGGTLFQSFEVVDFYFQSKVLSKFVSICKLTQLVISSLIKLYLIFIKAELFWFVLVSLIDQFTLAISLCLAYRYQRLRNFFGDFNIGIARKLMLDSWPLMLSGLVIMIYMRIDQIMIKEMLGEKEVGLYSAAVRLSEVWFFVPMLLTNSLFPSILNAKKTSNELYCRRLQRLFTFLVWVSIIVAVFISFLSEQIIVALYGIEYRSASVVLIIQIWSGLFLALGVVSGAWLTSENLQRFAFYRTALGAIVNVLLNFIFIPKYGIIGAAAATVASQSVAALFFDLLSAKTRYMFLAKLKSIFFLGL